MSLTHYVGCRKSCFICNIWSTPKRDKMMSAISVCSPSPSRNGEMKNDPATRKFNDPKTLSGFVFAIMALWTQIENYFWKCLNTEQIAYFIFWTYSRVQNKRTGLLFICLMHSLENIWVNPFKGGSFWQKDSLITQILFKLCPKQINKQPVRLFGTLK